MLLFNFAYIISLAGRKLGLGVGWRVYHEERGNGLFADTLRLSVSS